jgi:putative endopeptidase
MEFKMKRYFYSASCILITIAISICFLFIQGNAQVTTLDPLASHIDNTVRPGDDFFLYANGKWFKENPIPPSEQSNGLWQMIQDTINAQIRNVCESSA